MDLGGSCSRLLSHRCQLGNGLALLDSAAWSAKGLPTAWQHSRRLCCSPWFGQNWILLPSVMEGAKGMRQSPTLCQRSSDGKCKIISNLGLD